jgi:AraC-like DNA-binding protein
VARLSTWAGRRPDNGRCMKQAPPHQCQVFGSPWPGVHGTRIESARHYGRHSHACFGFGLLEQGAQSSASGRGPVEAHAGDLITTNPGEVHDGRPLGGPARRWRMLYLEPDAMAAAAAQPGLAVSGVEITRPVLRDAPLARALRHLFAQLDRWAAQAGVAGFGAPGRAAAAAAQALACEEALVRCCTLLLQGHAAATVVREAGAGVARARERLADDWLQPPTLADLAAMAGLSRYQLLRRFEQAYGLPPHAWLLQQRAEQARRLIRSGAGLAAAAAACGFADQSHMTRRFMRLFGFTPGAWQRATAGREAPGSGR